MNRANFGNQITNGAQVLNVGINSNDKTIKRLLGRADTTLNNKNTINPEYEVIEPDYIKSSFNGFDNSNEFSNIYRNIENNYNWLENRKHIVSSLNLLGGK